MLRTLLLPGAKANTKETNKFKAWSYRATTSTNFENVITFIVHRFLPLAKLGNGRQRTAFDTCKGIIIATLHNAVIDKSRTSKVTSFQLLHY